MTILGIVVAICVILFALWLVQTYVSAPWQTPLLLIIVVVALIGIVVTFFPAVGSMRVGR